VSAPVAPPGLTDRPELPLDGRHRLAFTWIPDGARSLLDAGCAWGYATREFALRSLSTAGIDPDAEAIAVATHRYPEIEFTHGVLEHLPYEDASFDVVTCCDTLEHVADERGSLDELWRVLAPGGTLIITTPHSGLFGWLDHANVLSPQTTAGAAPSRAAYGAPAERARVPDTVRPARLQHRRANRQGWLSRRAQRRRVLFASSW
jgi:SAM-dependent methyltransferase